MFYRLLLLFQLLHPANIAWDVFKLLIGASLSLNLGHHGLLETNAIMVTFHTLEMAYVEPFFLSQGKFTDGNTISFT